MDPWMDPKLPGPKSGHHTLTCLYGKLAVTLTSLYDKQENNSISGMDLESDK
jgi:hypothetical protein